MEDTRDSRPPVASPTAERGGGSTVVPPPASSSAQGSDPVVGTGSTGATPPPVAREIVEREENGEGEKERKGGSGDGDPAASGSGGDPATKAAVAGDGSGGSGEGREREIDVGGSSGLGSGGNPALTERVEERDEEMVEVQDVDSDDSSGSEETVEGASGVTRTRVPRWRIEPRPSRQPSEGDKGKAAMVGGESPIRGQSSRPTAQGPVGISRGDYLEHALPEVVMAAAADAPGILDAAREAVVEIRERGGDATGGRR